MSAWRERAGSVFECEKQPVCGSWGMAATLHPLASAAAVEAIACGGNAVDAALAALFTLFVVQPMGVGVFGGGTTLIRTPAGKHIVLDGLCAVPAGMFPDIYEPLAVDKFSFTDVRDSRNSLGAESIAVPGSLAALCETARRFARLPLAALMDSAIRHAARGFIATPYLANLIRAFAPSIARDAPLASLLMPGGLPLAAGERLVQGALADTLRVIAREGAAVLHGGVVGDLLSDYIARIGGYVTQQDLRDYRVVEREAVRGTYRDYEIIGPPPPASSGVLVVEMLNILEAYDMGHLGFGTAQSAHLIAEASKIIFADRPYITDPAFLDVPVALLMSKGYANERRRALDMTRTQQWRIPNEHVESKDTTHVTTADREGWLVVATHTLCGGFGANVLVPELGLICNNAMREFDPRPGRPQSIAPGKRMTSNQAPMIVVKEGRPRYALGLVGGLTIVPSAAQAISNLIDHGMSLQEAIEAPRLWTRGHEVQVEPAISAATVAGLVERGHEVLRMQHVGNGMNAVAFHRPGAMEGAACWRSDGAPMGVGGGLAQADYEVYM
jgi:gamma-glutamyltranspeptidase/glutathione hydrolase